MKLSIIIVNYNVRNFLEQCLNSVSRAAEGIDCETFVVDNQSVDGSASMVRNRFPGVILLENEENLGFSKANNQAIRMARGEYILVLNPDTILQQDSLKECIRFMDSKPEAGALGVKMIDGKGRFLPESKRAMPTPSVALWKMTGLSKLFPGSRLFGRYHLSFLDPGKTHDVEIVSGAFMFLRKKALDKAGLFDEQFFMYGEDIDLSYRILQAGFRNYYHPGTTIIHYKGESTRKGSLNYVISFYKAMLIFAHKHFSGKQAFLFSILIQIAIYVRASLSAIKRAVRPVILPLADLLLIYVCFYFLVPWWEQVRFAGEYAYPPIFLKTIIPAYSLVWVAMLAAFGSYRPGRGFFSILKGIAGGTILILSIYSLLPESMRFSRFLVISGSLLALLVSTITRSLSSLSGLQSFYLFRKPIQRAVIMASWKEAAHITELLRLKTPDLHISGRVYDKEQPGESNYLGKPEIIDEISRINRIDVIIFSAADVLAETIIQTMLRLSGKNILFRIASSSGKYVLGGKHTRSGGEFYQLNLQAVNSPLNKVIKRSLDLLLAVLMFLLSPLVLIVLRSPRTFLLNALKVASGKLSWIGPQAGYSTKKRFLPGIKEGVFDPSNPDKEAETDERLMQERLIDYASHYSPARDLKLFLLGVVRLSRFC
jgi:O-antigen biosynthesis protein